MPREGILLRNSLKTMTMKKLTTLAAVLTAVATLVTSSHALTASQVTEIKNTVLSVPVPEMPAKAAELVTKAEKKDRQAVAITAVRAIVMKHRAAAPVVVAAVSKVAPDLAPVITLEATRIAPEQRNYIVRSATLAAPAQATQVATVVSTPSVASTVVGTRGSAAQQPTTGTVRIDDQRITGEDFPSTQPNEAPEPTLIYNQPPAE